MTALEGWLQRAVPATARERSAALLELRGVGHECAGLFGCGQLPREIQRHAPQETGFYDDRHAMAGVSVGRIVEEP